MKIIDKVIATRDFYGYKGIYVKKGEVLNAICGCFYNFEGEKVCDSRSCNGEMCTKPYTETLKEKYLLNQDVVRVVEDARGKMYFVLKDRLISFDSWNDFKYYDENLNNEHDQLKIVKVYESKINRKGTYSFGSRIKDDLKLVWQREEKTPQQIEKESIEAEMKKLAERLNALNVK